MNDQLARAAAVWVMAVSLVSCRSQSPSGQALSLAGKVDAYLQPFIDAGGFSGAVLMAKEGRILFKKGYGLASREFGVPNTTRTKFQIASLSKSFTAAAVLMLQEAGRLRVGDPLARFIPDYPAGDRITVHHLLTHTSGIPNVNGFPEYDRESRFPHTLTQVIALFKDKPLRFNPGERYEYSNSNYNLLAFIVETASGLSYGEFLEKNIFGPLGMKDTGHRGQDGEIIPDLAAGYVPAGAWGLERAPYLDWSIKTGNGSLYSTVEDLFRWDRALRDGRVLAPDSRREMFKDHVSGTGYGWFVGERSRRKVVRFNGRSPGFTSYLERYPDDDACVIILSNNYAPVPHIAVNGLRAILFSETVPDAGLATTGRPEPEDLKRYEGRYRFGPDFFRPGAEVEVLIREGDLAIRWSETFVTALRPHSATVFLDRLYWATIIFQLDASGRAAGFVWRDSSEYSASRIKGDVSPTEGGEG